MKKSIYSILVALLLINMSCSSQKKSIGENISVDYQIQSSYILIPVEEKAPGIKMLVETANPSNVVAEVIILNSPGRTFMGDDYSVSSRVSEAYAKAGKEFAKQIKKSNK